MYKLGKNTNPYMRDSKFTTNDGFLIYIHQEEHLALYK